MVNVYLDAARMQAPERDLDRALRQRDQFQAALAGQPSHRMVRFTLVPQGVDGRGTQLGGWGNRLQHVCPGGPGLSHGHKARYGY